ncbi:MAG: GNAT family N-acetyltransferase [Bacteroidota bacterium]
MQITTPAQPILRDLGNGLILRRSSPADAQALADFSARIHSDAGPDHPDVHVAAWVLDLLGRPHPTFHADDFTVVAEASTGRIVSTLNLISQTWTYEGIPFGVGRPELVATLPEYRNRGLIRLQFDEIHRWSAERGEMVQAITGIPFYYRQFGYEMALDLAGRRFGYEANVPRLKDGEAEPFVIRPAADADLPFVAGLYAEAQRRYAISCLRSAEVFGYELNGQSMENANHFELMIIEDPQGEALGYFQHPTFLGQTGLSALGYELKSGVSWLEVSPCVARHLWAKGKEYAERGHRSVQAFGFMLGSEHPAYEALGEALPGRHEPYAYYLRVPDLPGFLRHIAPALEERLRESLAAGCSGELRISFYREGLRLVFERGRLRTVEAWKPQSDRESAAFPGLTFLQMLFGYRSFDELHFAFADCYWNDGQARVLLNALFPRRLSDVFPVS